MAEFREHAVTNTRVPKKQENSSSGCEHVWIGLK